MKGDEKVIECLNAALRSELTAVSQYWLHYRLQEDWGFGRIAAKSRAESIEEMHHADKLIERVLFIEGLPNLQELGKLLIGENVPEMLQGDLQMLGGMRTRLQGAIALCEERRDFISRDELNEVLEETEEQIDWIETQRWLIEHTGLENYLQSQF